MKYYIDIGNSELKIYGNNGDLLRIKNTKDNKVIEEIKSILIPENYFIISSIDVHIRRILEKYLMDQKIGYHFFTNKDYKEFFSNYNINLDALGEDRALNMIALHDKVDKCIIIDFGTALTIDIVTKNTYDTGFIYPGIDIVKNGLVAGTSKIEDFTMTHLSDGPLLTTDSQINDAIILGYFGMINSCIDYVNTFMDLKDYKLILTGGSFSRIMNLTSKELFDKFMKKEYEKIDNLNYLGLKKVEEKLKL